MTHENQRRETRIDARVPVSLLRGKTAFPLETSDVSFKGLFVCTFEPPALRALVRLRVEIPGRSFEAHAMAVHVVPPSDKNRDPGVGLQFWGLSGADRKAWDEFVQGLHAKNAKPKPAPQQLIVQTPHPAGTEPVSGVRIVPHGLPVHGVLPDASRGSK